MRINPAINTLEKRTFPKMNFNKITLSFQDDVEKIFRIKYFNDSLLQFRASFLLVTLLYAGFGYLDAIVVKEYQSLFHLIRFAIVVPLLTLVFVLSFSKYFIRVWQQLLIISFIVGGSGIVVMIIKIPDNSAYYLGMMLIFIGGYFFINLRFFWATITGWTTLLIFNIAAIFFSSFESEMLISINFFFISANIIGMFAAYNIEYYKRKDFYLNQQLDRRNALIEDANLNLKSLVHERTKELNDAKEKAEESDRLKSAFLANMSHEIRTPMNGILGFAEILKEPDLSGEEQQKYIGIIEKSGARMLNIINNIVDISKIEAGLMEAYVKESNVNEQMEYISTFFKPEAQTKGIKLSYENTLPADEAIVKTDREKLYAILTNLVKNAIKYTEKGAINFGYAKKDGYLEFFVKDTGIGIAKDRQEAIFERFVQADIEDKMARQGAGLGLAITKSYVEMLGGKIWVESSEGNGSSFYFTLPYTFESDNAALIESGIHPENESSSVKNLKILIAEDDETSEMLVTIMVDKFGREILTTRTGRETVEVCRDQPDIDLILMDLLMPEMSGLEATRQIREFNKNVIIIAQTAYGLAGDREKALEAGCNDYIAKPLSKDLLQELIQKHFEESVFE